MKRWMGTFCLAVFLISMSSLSFADFIPAPSVHHSASSDPFEPKFIRVVVTGNSWFVGVGGGYDWATLGDTVNTLVNNTLSNPADTFTLSESSQSSGVEELYVGYRFKIAPSNYLSLQLDYEYVNQVGPSGTRVAQGFTAPFGGVSNYSFDVSHNSLLLLSKLNLFKIHSILPFLQAGVGIASVQFSGFQDNSVAFPMPAFPNKTQYNFSSMIGGGIDWEASKNILLSLAYRYCWWGDVNSGSVSTIVGGGALPAPIHLSNSLTSQQILGSLTYL